MQRTAVSGDPAEFASVEVSRGRLRRLAIQSAISGRTSYGMLSQPWFSPWRMPAALPRTAFMSAILWAILPFSEASFVGAGVGAAIAGLRPVVDIKGRTHQDIAAAIRGLV